MSDEALARLAEQVGISLRWHDFRGHEHTISPDILKRLLLALDLPCSSSEQIAESRTHLQALGNPKGLPPLVTAVAGEPTQLPGHSLQAGTRYALAMENGDQREGRLEHHDGRVALPAVDSPGYHHLQIDTIGTTLAVAPPRCMTVAERCRDVHPAPWAVAAQLYGLSMPGDGGIGTYGALGHLARRVADQGAAALAVSPVHALFSAETAHRSPYSPSSRLLLNALHVDPHRAFGDAAAQVREDLGLGGEVARFEADTLIDWKAAGDARLAILRQLFERYLPSNQTLNDEFASFRDDASGALADHAVFEALHGHFLHQGIWNWRQWPMEYHDPASPAVRAFAEDHHREVRFHEFLQWLAARELGSAQREARQAGMPIGLISDLAIGSDPGGSHVWSRQRETLVGVSIGAPPDPLAMGGQVWGLATLSPTAMRENGFGAFIELLRASMAHAGGIRIDHVLGLRRLWLVPEGASSEDGAYLAYPWRDLLRLVALESWRHDCVVIGEDLGTVPEGFRDTLAAHGVLGMSVLWFERDHHGGYLPARQWRPSSVGMTTTHDLPTSAGWWLGRDIEVRSELGMVDSPEDAARQQHEREAERDTLWRALHESADDGHVPPRPDNGSTDEFLQAAIAHVARTPTEMTVVPLEDVLGLTDTPNVPGTSDEHPNWRRRLPADLDTLLDSRPASSRLELLDRTRRSRK